MHNTQDRSSQSSLTCQRLKQHVVSVFKVISEIPVFSISKYSKFGEGLITSYVNVLRLTRSWQKWDSDSRPPGSEANVLTLSYRDRSDDNMCRIKAYRFICSIYLLSANMIDGTKDVVNQYGYTVSLQRISGCGQMLICFNINIHLELLCYSDIILNGDLSISCHQSQEFHIKIGGYIANPSLFN